MIRTKTVMLRPHTDADRQEWKRLARLFFIVLMACIVAVPVKLALEEPKVPDYTLTK
ncbi:MAG: hypothetical protein AAGG72_03620 [Pseudomonadota bacterium]